ncbi:hypothetical protein KSP39_PZI016706 [Platanthera zijinensis]|uniref:Uncharacterized protein n=1 Tax=Platanthera zijinensis TaxID=2320716 RepID=A0AAP0G0N4_9ASPA
MRERGLRLSFMGERERNIIMGILYSHYHLPNKTTVSHSKLKTVLFGQISKTVQKRMQPQILRCNLFSAPNAPGPFEPDMSQPNKNSVWSSHLPPPVRTLRFHPSPPNQMEP